MSQYPFGRAPRRGRAAAVPARTPEAVPARAIMAFVALTLVASLALAPALALGGCRPQLAGGGDTGGSTEGTPGGDAGSGGTGGTTPGGTTPPPGPATAACPLCGVEVERDSLLHRPLAVSIDNLAAARPQSGLGDACLVYEVLAEGGITRFVAFFLHNDTAAIGPVRSLRHYMLDLVMPLGAPVAHVGGSPQAMRDASALSPAAMNINEMEHGDAFWRSESRRAPHNCYTSLSALRSASQALGYEGKELTQPTPPAFNFAPAADKVAFPSDAQSVTKLTLTYATSGGYAVTYDYDTTSGQWMRYLGGAAHNDAATGKQLWATTVIVQYVSSWVIPGDTEGRLELAMTGDGDAVVFTQGKMFDAAWSKASRTAPFVYTDAVGNPLTLPPGPVWVLICPPGSRLDTQ